jgi:type VI protein secretion system component Hcp
LTTTAINPDGSRGGSQTFSWVRLNNVPGTSPISAPSAGGTLAGASPTDATYFLAIDGLNGGATDPTHRGWFEVSSHDFSVQITAGRPTFSPLTVTLSATGSTGVLADLLEGATLPPPTGPSGSFPIRSMRLEGVIGNDQVVYDLTLGNVTVTNYEDASGGDTLTFSYQQIALATVPQNNDGSFGNPLTFGWDVPTRQEITAGSIPDPAPRVTPSTAGNVVPANLHYFLARLVPSV